MAKKIRINLTQNEYETLNHITSATKTDCWFLLDVDSDGYDCVYDLEKSRKVTLRFAVEQLYEAVEWMTFEDWKELGVDEQEVGIFAELLEKLEII